MPIKVTISSPQAQRISVNDQQRTGVRQIGITSDASLASGTVQSIAITTTEGLSQSGSPITTVGTIIISANLATTTQTGVVRLNDTLTAQNTTTALTANMGYFLSQQIGGKVQNTTSIITGNGLVGGGDLSVNRTITANDASLSVNGIVRLNDTLTSQNTGQALTANMGNFITQQFVGKVQNTRTISTTSPLAGGGDLTTDRTLSIQAASTTQNGEVRLNDTLTSANVGQALTANMGRYLDAKSVPNTRQILTAGGAITGGGDLTADRTLVIANASLSVNGVVRLEDSLTSTNTGTAPTSNIIRYLDIYKVSNTRQVLTVGGAITGGGTLQNDLTLTIANASTSVNGVVRLNDTLTGQNTGQALTANMGFWIASQFVGKVQNTTSITTGNGLVGGGDLTTNRTISANDASLSVNGVVRLNDTLASQNTGQALTANMGFWITSQLAGKVQNTRFINTTSPLFGGTTFDSNPSLTIGAASTVANGETRLNDTLTSPNTFQAATANVANQLARPFIGTYDGLVSNNATNNPTGNGQYVLNASGNWVAPGTGGGGSPITVAANVALALNSTTSVLTTIYNTSISDSIDSIAVGGAAIANAAVWKTRNIVQVLDTILFPDVLPTYTNPTISFSGTVSGTQEIGSTITQTMTSTGTKNDANTFTAIAFRRGGSTINTNTALVVTATTNVADQFGYTNPNRPNFTYTGTNTNIFVVIAGSTSWDAQGNYGAGNVKKNNKGVDDVRAPAVRNVNAPQAACTTFGSSSTSITGIYPYFWGVSAGAPTVGDIATAIAAGTTNKVLTAASGTVTVTFGAVAQYVWMAHIATDTSKTKWYNTALNNGDIGPGQFILSPVLQNVNSPDGYWTSQSFKVYISGFATTTSGSIEFRNT